MKTRTGRFAEQGGKRQESESEYADEDVGSSTTEEPGMFSGLTAWFSSSVDNAGVQAWSDNDGILVACDRAMFLFSADSEASDTKRLYESDAYVHKHIAIFHADVMADFLREGDIKKVSLGKYFLPPKSLHEVIKKQVSFKWETNAQRNRTTQRRTPSPRKNERQKTTTMATSSRRSDSAERVQDVQGSNSGTSHQAPPADQDVQDVSQTSPPRPSTSVLQSQKRPAAEENTVLISAYVDVDQLPKVQGDLYDFTFGQNGCQVINK